MAGEATGRLRALLRHRLTKGLLVANLVAALLLPLREAGWLQALELGAYDRGLTLAAAAPASAEVVVTTESDINRFGYPIRDPDLAAVLERVFSGNPAAVGVDLYRDLPMGPEGHERLQAVQRAHDNLYWVFKLPDAGNQGVPAPEVLRGTGREVLADNVTDAGGVVRRALLLAEDPREAKVWETMGVALAQRLTGLRLGSTDDDPEDVVRFGRARIRLLSEPWGPYARVDAAGYQMPFDFRGGHHRFRQISFAEILDDPALARTLQGKLVLVGTAALSIKDSFATPFSTGWGGEGPLIGIALHAHIADQLIRLGRGESRNPGPLPRAAEHALVWGAANAGAVLALLVARALPAVVALLAGLGAIGAAGLFGFQAGLVLPAVPVGLAWLLSAAGCNVVMNAAGQRERAQLRRSFENYLDPRLIADMLAADQLPSFGGEKREISAIFTDIAGFTSMAESMDAARVAELLGDYFDELGRAVMAEGGLVADYIGDAMVVLFGAPMRQPDHADRAVAAALAIDAAAEAFLARCQAEGTPWGHTRVGVHSGPALVGNIGSRGRMKYSALGDTMNTASRVEGLNKYLGTRVCVTGATAALCTRHRFRPVADVIVKGRATALPMLVPLRGDEPAALLQGYAAAQQAMGAERPEAAAMFAALHQHFPEDAPAAFHARRLAGGAQGSMVVMDEK